MTTSIIVLAAGASKRMGTPKPLLDFDGRSCLSLVLDACSGSRAGVTILVLGADAEAVRAEAARWSSRAGRDGPRIVVNEQFDRGQTSSLKTGLEALTGDTDGFVILPVDLPLVTSAEIDALIERSEAHPRGRTIFVATFENQPGHPTLFSDSHRSPILELGDDEPLSAYVGLREGETERVDVGNPGVVAPMNTREQYRAALKMHRERQGKDGRQGSRQGGHAP